MNNFLSLNHTGLIILIKINNVTNLFWSVWMILSLYDYFIERLLVKFGFIDL